MKDVTNLKELLDLVGKDTVDRCFIEYMMSLTDKSKSLDKLRDDLEVYTAGRLKNEQVHLTVGQLQNIIDGKS